jgi:hypothetical protein
MEYAMPGTISLATGDLALPNSGSAVENPLGRLAGLIRPRRHVRRARGPRTLASAEAALPLGQARPVAGAAPKVAGITVHLSNFKRTGNPVSLWKAGSLVIRQGRLREVLYGVRCFLTVRPAPVVAGSVPGESFKQVIRDLLAIHHPILPSTFSPELRRKFPVHLLPPDLVTYTHIFAECDDWMIVGEYAESARMYFLNHDSCTPIPYYTQIPAVRHIHSVHRLSDTQVLVSTGDKAKLFDLWDVNASGMTFSKRLMRQHGGFLSSAKVAGDDYFGTDFSERPNFIYRYRDGKKWFLPKPAFTKYVLRLRAVDDRYLVSLNTSLEALGGDRAWTVFDTRREEFIHAAAWTEKEATSPQPAVERSVRRRRAPAFSLPLPRPLAESEPSFTS